jgi:hypothetical protein
MFLAPEHGNEAVRDPEMIPDKGFALLGHEAIGALLPMIIELPDGQLVTVEALVAAVTAGLPSIESVNGEAVPVELAYAALSKEIGKIGSEVPSTDGTMGGPASFRAGATLELLNSILLSGRVNAIDEDSRVHPEFLRRSKPKTSSDYSQDDLRDVLIDGPVAGDDVIRPPRDPDGNASMLDFEDRLINEPGPPVFQSSVATGNLLQNDAFGKKSSPEIASIEYRGVAHKAISGQIVVEEVGIWRLTVETGERAGTKLGDYVLEHYGPYSHLQGGSSIAIFDLSYTLATSDGKSAVGTIEFAILDDVPLARGDYVTVQSGGLANGSVLSNDSFGGDGPGGVIRIGDGRVVFAPKDGDQDGRVMLSGMYGDLVFDFDDGSYEYRAHPGMADELASGIFDVFHYMIEDADGDATTGDLRFQILPLEESGVLRHSPEIPETGIEYAWGDISDVDRDGDGNVDVSDVINGFDPAADRLDIDGLLESLGYKDLTESIEVFRLSDDAEGVMLQLNLGQGWQTFATVSGDPALAVSDLQATLVG